MTKSSVVSAAEANRSFSKIFRRAAEGETITITDRGKPVAVLSPVSASAVDGERAERRKAITDLVEHLRHNKPMNLGPIRREWAYEDS